MARKYSPVWNKLKTTSVAEVTVSGSHRATIRQAIKKLKTEENVNRRNLGMLFYGKLTIIEKCIDKDRDMWRIEFGLEFNPNLL